ncbi:MAG: hypothetical protein DRI65_02750 [Chloroflexota bacterium]|nr:MAG: hypothetical protein DRI65_02750 [Chloroflexota bacterium]
MNKLFIKILLLLSFSIAPIYAIAADDDTPIKLKEVAEQQEADEKIIQETLEKSKKGPYDEFERITPRSSLLGLALSVQNKDFERAANYLDLRNLPFSVERDFDGTELSRKLSIIASQVLTKISFESISDDPRGHLDDGLPSYRDRVRTLKTQNGEVDILMQRIPRGDGVFIWKISNATVGLIPELYDEFGYSLVGDKLAEIFPHTEILGFEIWQLVMLLGIIIISFAVGYVITFLIVKILQLSKKLSEQRIQRFLAGPLRFFIAVIIFRSLFDEIGPSLVVRAIFEAKTLLILASFWMLVGIIDFAISRFAERMKRNGQPNSVVLLKPATTGIKLILLLIIIIVWLDNLGFEITAVIAGLGVGGVAVALASQKSLENLIGSITIYSAQPVRVGDFCKFGGTLGTVEEIGLRSTQLRTLSRTVVHIPNALFSSEAIENLTQRDKILYRCRLRLSYDVTPAQLRAVLARIRELIEQDEHIDSHSSRVRFIEFGDYAQELELYVYLKTTEFTQYLEYLEETNLNIIDILSQEGVKLIIPAHTTYLEKASDIQAV